MSVLKAMAHELFQIVQQLEVLQKFIDPSDVDAAADHHSLLQPIDSYSEQQLDYGFCCAADRFFIDKLSLKFNLACCYSRMPSRLDFTSGDEVGVKQGTALYM